MSDDLRNIVAHWIARHLPRRVLYWAYITVHAEATTGKHSDKTPDEVSWKQALEAFLEYRPLKRKPYPSKMHLLKTGPGDE